MGEMERRSPTHRNEAVRERKWEEETKPHTWPGGRVVPSVGQVTVL